MYIYKSVKLHKMYFIFLLFLWYNMHKKCGKGVMRMEAAQERAAKDACNAYNREWRARNKDKVKAYNRTYWARKAAQKAAQKAERKDGNTE